MHGNEFGNPLSKVNTVLLVAQLREVMKFTRSVFPYIYSNLQPVSIKCRPDIKCRLSIKCRLVVQTRCKVQTE